MKLIEFAIVILFFALTFENVALAQDELQIPDGPYLGQKAPGLTPEIFAPGVVSTEHRDYSGFFSPDLTEFYFTRRDNDDEKWSLIGFTSENGSWHQTSVTPRLGRPILSPSGEIMHLGKSFKTRVGTGWSEIESLGPPYDEIRIMRLMSSAEGTYVLDEATGDGTGLLRYSRVIDGKREEPEPFGREINSGKWNAHPYIAPDESYLIWDGDRTSGFGDNDLYISFREPDGSWGEAINMGDEINTEAQEGGAIVSPDGKYLFFNRSGGSGNGDIFWVDAEVIDDLRYRDTDNFSPEATPLESRIRHWSLPEINRNFWHLPLLGKAWIDTSPDDRSDRIPVGELGVDGGDKDTIVALASEIENGQHGEVDSLLIAQQGKLLFESYYARGRVDLPHPQSSTTKAYTTLALGRAIQLGYLSLADLDKPIVSFLEGLDPSKFVEGADKISLHQALNMNSGLQISDEDFAKYREDPAQYNGIRQVQAYLEDSDPITADSRGFDYVGANPIMVMQVLDAVVPGSVEEFIRTELFGKLGITDYSWRNYESGLPMADTGSSFTSRDMLKLANMVIDNGRWDGAQLLPPEFVNRLGHRLIHLTDEQAEGFYSGDRLTSPGYAYFWWPLDITVDNRKYSATSAQGAGGITIFIVQELELVVVITGHSRQAFLQMIAEKVMPVFAKD